MRRQRLGDELRDLESSAWSAAGSQFARLVGTSSAKSSYIHFGYARPTNYGSPVSPDTTYTAAATVNITSITGSGAMVYLQITWYDAAGTTITSLLGPALATTGVKRLTLTGMSPSNAAYGKVLVVGNNSGNGTVSYDLFLDAVSFTATSTALRYFDGDSPAGAWTASGSTGYAWVPW